MIRKWKCEMLHHISLVLVTERWFVVFLESISEDFEATEPEAPANSFKDVLFL